MESALAITNVRRCVQCGRAAGYWLDAGPKSGELCWRHLARHRRVMRRAALTALVVGTVLTAINQGNLLFAGAFSGALLWKVPLTYCVPYCVTTWGALGAARRPA